MAARAASAAFLSLVSVLATALGAAPWVPIGPSGGSVTNIVVAPSDARVLYVTTPDLYRSDDGGAHWSLLHRGDYRLLAVDPRRPRRVFVEGAVSTDGGETFASVEARPPVYFSGLTFLPGHGDTLLAATSAGVLRTDNGGRTWRSTGLREEVATIVVSPRNPKLWLALENLYQGTHNPSGTLWRSNDAGHTWTSREVGFGPYGITGPEFDPLDPSRVYLMDGGLGLLVSRDGGQTFETATHSPRATIVRPAADGSLYTANFYGARSSDRLLVSRDHGATWSRPAGGAGSGPADSFTQLIIDHSTLLASGARGIWRSRDDGRTWRATSLGIDNLRSTSIAVSSDGASVYLGVLGEGVYRGSGTSGGWVPARHGLPTTPPLDLETWHNVTTVPGRPERAFDLTPAGLFVTDDRAATWRPVKLPTSFDISLANALAIDATANDRVAVAGARGNVLSEDGGVTWRTIQTEYSSAFAFDGGDRDRLYSVTLYGIQRSEDGGRMWKPLPWQLPPGQWAQNVWTVPNEAGVLFVAPGGGGLYGSDDGGSTFSLLISGTSGRGPHVLNLVPDPERPDNLYLLVVPTDAPYWQTELLSFSRSDHNLRSVDDGQTLQIRAIAARPGALGEVFGAGASAYRIDDQP